MGVGKGRWNEMYEMLKNDPEKLLGSACSKLSKILASMFFLRKKSAWEAILRWLLFKKTEAPIW